MRKILTAALTASTALIATPAVAAAPSVSCGATITEDTTLRSDLVCPGPALTVTGDGVELNLGGRLLRSTTGPALTVHPATEGAEIADVRVTGGRVSGDVEVQNAHRVALSYLAVDGVVRIYQADDASLRASRVRGSLDLQYAVRPVVQGNRVISTAPDSGPAISLLAVAPRVVGNSVDAGGNDGISLTESQDDERGLISRNTIRNADAGVDLPHGGSDVDVTRNRISDATHGIEVSAYGHRDVRIDGNDVRRTSGDAISVGASHAETSGYFTVTRNRVRDAGGHGILYTPDTQYDTATATVAHNDVRRVSGHGIVAPAASGDGNRVRDAGTAPACVGVTCR
ncbi:right-handed parallel beta-helix repeat-containing protein [Kineococcus sp. TRM81007]|uniref:right-handed parallel beta-helix repeat-containing protein n=1 Tax=Kineococcus sp. TRM81007 TaxID=2925831 RepID=UPI001F5AB407|nr:right-handed parallel beta-helix repeat-containing protein [Kineococcus sp. TRM81007]MCI2240145.1 right-handed parallel beta-helix repeat-containing protein [Kineococcus sp. TRM81007]